MEILLVQGDVFLTKINKIPRRAKRIQRSPQGYVLAVGEATGHVHVIESEIKCYECAGILYLETNRTVELKHAEHAAITIEPGIWQRGIVREWDAFQEESRNVKD